MKRSIPVPQESFARLNTNQLGVFGSVAPGFEEVAVRFRENFHRRREVGAACCIYHKGAKVVDLWGGYCDLSTRTAWAEDTLILVFSATKGLASMTLAVAHSQGLIDYEERVSVYWPEFAQQGKENITVRQLLSHQAGLCVTDEPVDATTLASPDQLAQLLARQKPLWEPGTRYAYHAFTLGWYEGELIRRVDPQHRTLGKFFQDEIAKPLGLEFYIGLPAEVPDSRLARWKFPSPFDFFFRTNKMSRPFLNSILQRKSLAHRFLTQSRSFDARNRAFLALENPGFTGVGRVSSIARAYSEFATGGRELGITPRTLAALTAAPDPPTCGEFDEMIRLDVAYSLGFQRSRPNPGSAAATRSSARPGLVAVLHLPITTPRLVSLMRPSAWGCACSMTHGKKYFETPSTSVWRNFRRSETETRPSSLHLADTLTKEYGWKLPERFLLRSSLLFRLPRFTGVDTQRSIQELPACPHCGRENAPPIKH